MTASDASRARAHETASGASRARTHETASDASRARTHETASDASKARTHETASDASRTHETASGASRARTHETASGASRSLAPNAARRRRLSGEEKRVRARDAEQRRDDRQTRIHAGWLEDEIADKPLAPNVIGAEAEERAVAALQREGYAIVHRNWKRDLGELDVVARDGDVLVFVEVRSREDDAHGHAAEMVTRRKRAKVTKVAYLYLVVERPVFDECRFDVVAVTGDSVEIVKDAWRGGS